MVDRSPAESARQLLGVATFFLILSTVTTVLRVYVKAFMVKSLGVDDAFAILAMLCGIATCVFIYEGVHYSGCNHMVDVAPLDIPIAMMYWKLTELGYVASTAFLKCSVGFLLLRIVVKRWQSVIIWFTMITALGYSTGYFFFVIFECRPAAYFWTRFYGITDGYCIPTTLFGQVTYGHSATSVVADWTLALLPIAIVWSLQMNPRTKITVSMILGLGAIASCAVVVRIPYVKALVESDDFLYDATDVVLWTIIEPGLGITAMNLATLRPLFKTFFSRTKLFGGPTAKKSFGDSSTPRNFSRLKNGYIRSTSTNPRMGDFELGLPMDSFSGKTVNHGVTTLVRSDYDAEGGPIALSESQEKLRPTGWAGEELLTPGTSNVTGQSSLTYPETSWPGTIRRTVVIMSESETRSVNESKDH